MSEQPEQRRRSPSQTPSPDDEPVVPDRADDDRDRGWGDDGRDGGDDDERFLRERPPHW